MNRARTHHHGTHARRPVTTRIRPQARSARPVHLQLSLVMLFVIASLLLSPLTSNLALAQDEAATEAPPVETVPAESAPVEEPAPAPPVVEQPATEPAPQEPVQPTDAPPATGSLEIRLTGSTGVALSGLFAVYDAAGIYQERWTDGGVAWFSDLIAGQATVYQISGTTDFAFNSSDPDLVDVPTGGQVTLPLTNAFLDADGDAVGDLVDICVAGDDAVDTDADGTPDACDDPTLGTPTVEPTPEESSEIAAMVAEEPVVVEEAPVTCQQAGAVSPWITTDLADYPPGSLVTLTGGNWVAGQVIELLVEDDGLADAEQGPWSHAATVTADDTGAFTYQFNLASWFVADYSVVATGECTQAQATFTDSIVSGTECWQVTLSDNTRDNFQRWYVEFLCDLHSATQTGTKYTRSISAPTAGWLTSIDNGIPSNSPHDESDVSSLNYRKIALSRDPAYIPAMRVGRVTVTVSTTTNGVTTTTTTILEAYDSSVPVPSSPCTPTVSLSGGTLNFGPLAWTGTAYPTGTAPLAIQVSSSGTGCSGFPATWSIQASTTDMGGDPGGTIPGDAISFTGTSGSQPTGLTPAGQTPLGIDETTIASGTSTTAPGTWSAGFSIAPPNDAPPGTYNGIITITVSTAGS